MILQHGIVCGTQGKSGYVSIGRDGLRSVFSNKVREVTEFEYICSDDDADYFQLRWEDILGQEFAARVKVGYATRAVQYVLERELDHEN